MSKNMENVKYSRNYRTNGGNGSNSSFAQKQNYVTDMKSYSRECTVKIEKINTFVIGERIVIGDIESITGLNSVLAVVKNDNESYDVTMDSKENAMKLIDGLDIAGREYQCNMLYSDVTVVSIMKLPSFVKDEEIIQKLKSKGVNIVSQIYRRAIPGTQVADGTRFMKCKFPVGMVSLPWTMPFTFESTTRYYRVVHNNQTKVCSECLSPEHTKKECPYIECHGCGEQGHAIRNCSSPKCPNCRQFPLKCVCTNKREKNQDRENENVPMCEDCGNHECTCMCIVCGKGPCECRCNDCGCDPCVCICETCKLNSCMCPDTDESDTEVQIERNVDDTIQSVASVATLTVNGQANAIEKLVDDMDVTHDGLKRKRQDIDTDVAQAANSVDNAEGERVEPDVGIGGCNEEKKVRRDEEGTSPCENNTTGGGENHEIIDGDLCSSIDVSTSDGDAEITTEGGQDKESSALSADKNVLINSQGINDDDMSVESVNGTQYTKVKAKKCRRKKLQVVPNLDKARNIRSNSIDSKK